MATNIKYALSLLAAVVGVDAFWRMECSTIQTGRIDAVVSFNAVSSHVHMVSGASNINTSSTFDSLRQSFCTSCSIQDDLSAYWTPLMYYQKADGTFIPVPQDGTVVYYLGRGDNRSSIVPFPPGFKMISGDPFARSYDNTTMTYSTTGHPGRPIADRVSFACLGTNYTNHPETPGFKYMDCQNGLRAQIQFQSCWDGKTLFAKDGSHVAYMSQIDNGICPPTHSVPLPHLFYEIYYFPNSIDTSDNGTFVFANGDATGYGFHGDFINGWDPDVLQAGVTQCLNSDDGQISDCPPLAKSNDENHSRNCPEMPPVVNEQVKGVLQTLPGCNTPTFGPGRASSTCNLPLPPLNNVTNMDGQKRFYPVINFTYTGMTYQGCYVEGSSGRALNAKSTSNDNMSLESCAAFCGGNGLSLFGLEFGRECYCGTAISTSQANLTDCNVACSGNITEWCGGNSRLSVFSINATAAVAPQTTPTVSGSTYMGCYSDTVNPRALTPGSSNAVNMTIEICQQLAVKNNYKYFGLEYGGECYAGNNISTTTTGPLGCNMPCKGNINEICGGSATLSIFQNSNYTQTGNNAATVNGATYNYLGCYTEGSGGRALGSSGGGGSSSLGSYSFSDSAMTVEKCASTCQAKGYMYIGTEYSRECYCNNVGPTNGAATASDADCSMTCAGSVQEFCGGSNRISVFKSQSSTNSSNSGSTRMKRSVQRLYT